MEERGIRVGAEEQGLAGMPRLPTRALATAPAQGAGLLFEAVTGGRLMGVVRGAAQLVFQFVDPRRERVHGLGLLTDRLRLLGQAVEQREQQGRHRRGGLGAQGGDLIGSQIQRRCHSARSCKLRTSALS